ncbi:MAG: DUF4831 family protein, partial [Bacteroidales bacterium]|nr:DUF4831 family protein [Candidatus Colimorpha onthohippi]
DISYDEDDESPAGLVRRQILDYNLYDRSDTFYTRFDHPGHPSMIATKKDSRTLRAQAQAAAERIGQLQDRRQQLLSGEYEASYTPEGIRLLLQLIDREEQQIQQQFVGRYVTERHRFTYTPRDEKQFIDSQSVVIFYFSPSQGIVDSAAPSGVPVRCSFRCDNKLRNAARFVKYRLGLFGKNDVNDRNTFKYRRSEQAQVVVSSPYFTVQQMLPVAQFGPTIELPAKHFKAVFDSHTGDLIYFEN